MNYIEFFVCERENALNIEKPISNWTWAVAINSSSSRNTFSNSQQNTKQIVQETFYKTFNDRYFFCLKKKIYTLSKPVFLFLFNEVLEFNKTNMKQRCLKLNY